VGHERRHLYTNEKMTDNLSIYRKLGYVEVARRTENGFNRVYFEKNPHLTPSGLVEAAVAIPSSTTIALSTHREAARAHAPRAAAISSRLRKHSFAARCLSWQTRSTRSTEMG
jgi:hypothetical protein